MNLRRDAKLRQVEQNLNVILVNGPSCQRSCHPGSPFLRAQQGAISASALSSRLEVVYVTVAVTMKQTKMISANTMRVSTREAMTHGSCFNNCDVLQNLGKISF